MVVSTRLPVQSRSFTPFILVLRIPSHPRRSCAYTHVHVAPDSCSRPSRPSPLGLECSHRSEHRCFASMGAIDAGRQSLSARPQRLNPVPIVSNASIVSNAFPSTVRHHRLRRSPHCFRYVFYVSITFTTPPVRPLASSTSPLPQHVSTNLNASPSPPTPPAASHASRAHQTHPNVPNVSPVPRELPHHPKFTSNTSVTFLPLS